MPQDIHCHLPTRVLVCQTLPEHPVCARLRVRYCPRTGQVCSFSAMERVQVHLIFLCSHASSGLCGLILLERKRVSFLRRKLCSHRIVQWRCKHLGTGETLSRVKISEFLITEQVGSCPLSLRLCRKGYAAFPRGLKYVKQSTCFFGQSLSVHGF